jgi:hypothetical protein
MGLKKDSLTVWKATQQATPRLFRQFPHEGHRMCPIDSLAPKERVGVRLVSGWCQTILLLHIGDTKYL